MAIKGLKRGNRATDVRVLVWYNVVGEVLIEASPMLFMVFKINIIYSRVVRDKN